MSRSTSAKSSTRVAGGSAAADHSDSAHQSIKPSPVEQASSRDLIAGSGLVEAVVAMAGNLELTAVLDKIVLSACQLTGARYGALGVLGGQGDGADGRRLTGFHQHGIPDAQHAEIGEDPHGEGVLGLLINDPRPCA